MSKKEIKAAIEAVIDSESIIKIDYRKDHAVVTVAEANSIDNVLFIYKTKMFDLISFVNL